MQRRFAVPALAVAIVGAGLYPTMAGSQTIKDEADRLDCTPGMGWFPPFARVLARTEPVQRNENRTARTQTATFTSTRTRTLERRVSTGGEPSIGANFKFIQASIKAQFGIEVLSSKTATINNMQSVTVPPHYVAVGAYGVYTRTFIGRFTRPAHRGERGHVNQKCPRLRSFQIVTTVPLDEVGWVIKTFPVH
jgi:hypothetical protein